MIRVVVADDEPLIRAGIRIVLESSPEIEVVAEAPDGHTAVEALARHRADVALLDIKMPGLDGLGALEEIRRRALNTSVVMLTSFGQHENVVRALARGASGFVLKNCTPEELIRAVKAAHEGDAYLSPAVTRLVLGLVTPVEATRRNEAAQRLSTLTEREASILRLVAEGNSNAEVGRRLHMSETTIKTYVSRILSKLHCSNRVQAALMVRDAGG